MLCDRSDWREAFATVLLTPSRCLDDRAYKMWGIKLRGTKGEFHWRLPPFATVRVSPSTA